MEKPKMRPSLFSDSTFAVIVLAAILLVPTAFLLSRPALSGDQTDREQSAPPETGLWYDDTKRGAVEISQCGNHLCGHIVWLKEPFTKDGKPIHDKYNTDTSKNKRPVCGIQVLGNLSRQADGSYDHGWVYDPKNGFTFNVAVNLVDPMTLHVRGYAKLKLFGQSLYWTRAPDDLERCTNQSARSSSSQ